MSPGAKKIVRSRVLAYLIFTLVLVNLGANMLVVFGQFMLQDYIYQPDRVDMMNRAYGENPILVTLMFSLSFAFPTSLGTIYSLPVVWMILGKYEGEKLRRAKRRLINQPIGQSTIAITGWVIGISGNFVALWLVGIPITGKMVLLDLLNLALMSIFSFTMVYFTLESIVRKFFIPVLLDPDESVYQLGGIRISIRFRMMITYVATAILPAVLLVNFMLIQIPADRLPVLASPLEIILTLMLAAGISLIWMVSSSYEKPLDELVKETRKIERGDFNLTVRPVSNDEVGILTETLVGAAKGLAEKEFIKDTFGRIVDPSVRDHLLGGNISLGGESREVTVLFSDIRSFTSISERESPERIVDLLNRYFDRIHGPIQENSGTVNKYIGDAVMALFNAPIDVDNHADFALKAAIGMRAIRDALNLELEKEGFPAIRTGFGIHTGTVVAGNIGSSIRMEYTVIGDTVNLASRLEGVSKAFDSDIIISADTVRRLKGEYPLRRLGQVKVKGKDTPVEIFTIDP